MGHNLRVGEKFDHLLAFSSSSTICLNRLVVYDQAPIDFEVSGRHKYIVFICIFPGSPSCLYIIRASCMVIGFKGI